MASSIAFFVFAAMAIAFSLMVVLKRNPVSCAFSLVLVFFSFAGIYATLSAHLIAALQVLVYAGAIMVLFIFVIMLLNADEPSLDLKRTHPIVVALAALFSVVLFAGLVWVFKQAGSRVLPASTTASLEALELGGGNAVGISKLLFSKYILPFELTSVLLLAAIVGAVALAKRKPGKAVSL